jgi:hypothetical protein
MKTLRLLALSLITAAALQAADSLPLFNAFMTMGKEQRFVLLSADGKPSSWLKLGATFDGYTLKAYDEKSGELQLERDGKVTKVTIVGDAATKDSGSILTATPATLADADNVLSVMHFDEMMSKIIEQQKKAMTPMFAKMMDQLKVPAEDRERFAALQKKVLDEAMNSVMGPEMKADVARIYSNVFTKEELASMSSFYSTPGGQAMVAKQPQVQEQMMQSMMPRMMQVGPKMQELAKNYMAEQRAKADTSAPAPTPAPKSP